MRPEIAMRSVRVLSALVALAVLSLACGGAGDEGPRDASGAPAGATAVAAISSDLSGVNPLLSNNSVTRAVLDAVFVRLLAEQPDFSAGPPSFEPRLAESWSWSEDGRTLTLELRRDARWSDGAPVTAADVVWSFDAAADPAIAWTHSETRERIEGYRALGEHTVEVRFQSAYPNRLSDLNECPILPRHVWSEIPFAEWRQNGGWFRRHLVASGPFVVADWKANSEVVLRRNPHYFRDGRPRLDRLVLLVVPDRVNRLEMLLAGEIDFVTGLRPSVASRVEASPRADLFSYWHRQYHYLVWNGCEPPFDDPVVRRALTLAVDRQSVIEAVYGDYARMAVSPVLSSAWVFARELEPWPWDPAEARRLLAARGFTDSDGDGLLDRDGETLHVGVATNVESEMRADMATMIHSQLRDVGVDAELVLREFGVLMDALRRHDFEAGLSSWIVDTSFDLKNLFHSEAVGSGQNFGCYRNPEVDRLIDLAREQTDLAELKRILIEIQELVHRDQPYTFLAEVQRLNGVSRRLGGVTPSSLTPFGELEEWSIGPPEPAAP